MSHTVDILVSSPKWYTRLPASSLTCLVEDTHCIHDQRPSLQIKSPKAPASFNRKGFIDHYSRMSYHLRKRCDQESTKENDSTSHLKRRTKRITRQQQNESFNLNFYKELRRSLVKETVQETHECIQPSTTDNVVSSQRCNAKNTGIRQRTTRDWKLDFTIPLEYQYASLDIDSADNEFYSLPEWLPNMDRVDQVMLELKIGHQETCEAYINDPYLPRLHPSEKSLAAHLRIPASKYLRCKRALIMSAYEFRKHGVSMRPFDAQKLLRINANKSYRLHKIFQKFGWLEPHSSTS